MGFFLVLILLLCQLVSSQNGTIYLDEDDDKHVVTWSLLLPGPSNKNDASIRFTLTWNRTLSDWAAFAIGYGMSNADVFMMSIDSNLNPTLVDRYSKAHEVPALDTSIGGKNDLILESSTVWSNGYASVTFLRKAVTGDTYDLPINVSGLTGLIWAYGPGTALNPSQHIQEGGDPDPAEGEPGISANFFVNYTSSDSPQTFQLDTQYSLEWVVLPTNELRLTFIWSNTNWAAIGFGKVMAGSDIIMVSVNDDGNNAMAKDRYGTSSGVVPVLDNSNDIKLESATVSSSGVKRVTIRRALNTGDTTQDAVLSTTTPTNIIWAQGPGTAMSPQQHTNRNSQDVSIQWTPSPSPTNNPTSNSTKSNGLKLTIPLGGFITIFLLYSLS
eukprot:NODE_3039_length_1436_cov_48.699924_g2642_i0.p1 GENE.NODE_3039_length_1436_cov_48.699924_g2642_i0~~NODE_3039_length_1436_cov_48.699924_g2642_i0.p1  ORF type:complete len:384 (-),score=75.92 NODE_3039_length_1436_cov_48.699924_g2642_i0:227-1378(-)